MHNCSAAVLKVYWPDALQDRNISQLYSKLNVTQQPLSMRMLNLGLKKSEGRLRNEDRSDISSSPLTESDLGKES